MASRTLADQAPRLVEVPEQRGLLIGGHVEELGDVALRNHQHMAAAERAASVAELRGLFIDEHVARAAQPAGHRQNRMLALML
ncbi:MAG: hypothetical protein E6H47_06775 [Betaproteobacteria bacterium]|nr:MAG: hypothetical protein E6H47_06775 [Betaproteobacteria bacterium]